jgi:hypothetical protein
MPLAREIKREKVTLEKKDYKQTTLNDDFFLSSSLGGIHDDGTRLYFREDPLPEVVSYLRSGHQPFQVHATIFDSDSIIDDITVTDKDVEVAADIRSHFLNKFLLRTLKNQELTKFQSTVQKMLYEPLELRANEIGALTKLYHFYTEDRQTEAIIKDAVSIENMHEPLEIDGIVTFAGSVERSARDGKFVRYYWKTANGNLIKVDANGSSNQAWRVVAKAPQLHIRGFVFVTTVSGYWFSVGDLKRSKFEILD